MQASRMAETSSLVYVVDDDESVLRAISRLIRSAGLDTETFPSAYAFLSFPYHVIRNTGLTIRVAGGSPAAIAGAVREQIRASDSALIAASTEEKSSSSRLIVSGLCRSVLKEHSRTR